MRLPKKYFETNTFIEQLINVMKNDKKREDIDLVHQLILLKEIGDVSTGKLNKRFNQNLYVKRSNKTFKKT